ncbi:hypothetical protein LPJ61_002245 [Coemansia biformis]|uniref:Uncharacterized protein n=1 Tax=Coemansia biformis TaxID=1286918 RepID=A0A9W7YEW5_9FUNG|nr:hypothetical protein LPJ61_002245 [Coemansia biformis]
MASEWAEVLGELRRLVYEWRFRRSQWSTSARNMELYRGYAEKTSGASRLCYLQTLQAEAGARSMLEDVRRLGEAVRDIDELRARAERMDKGGEPDAIHRVAGVTGEYVTQAVDQHWAAAASDYRRLARLTRGVLGGSVPLSDVAAALPPPAVDCDFEDRLLLVVRAEQVQATREEERRLGLAA